MSPVFLRLMEKASYSSDTYVIRIRHAKVSDVPAKSPGKTTKRSVNGDMAKNLQEG
jgi:hypothetical protein